MLPTKATGPRPRKWFIDCRKFERAPAEFPAPVGYCDTAFQLSSDTEENYRLQSKRSWDIALGPIKQIPMNVFIIWMAGNSLSLFPLMMIGMMLIRPIQSIFSLHKAFESFNGEKLVVPKAVFVIGNLMLLLLALYKCHSMGLLPLYASDWLSFATPQAQAEFSVGESSWP